MKRRWRRVQMSELETVRTDLKKRNILFNGCIHWELQNRYGAENIKHIKGHGWYKLT